MNLRPEEIIWELTVWMWEQGLTRVQVAARLGIRVATLEKMLCGKRPPNAALARLLGYELLPRDHEYRRARTKAPAP